MATRILIAEDDAHIVESLRFILGRAGYEVAAVADGEAALGRVRSQRAPDLLVLDVMLPLRNGFEVLKALRSDERTRQLPVLMLTAKAQPQDRAMAEEIGVDAYVTKPFSNQDVLAQVRRLTTR